MAQEASNDSQDARMRALVVRWFEDMWNRADESAIDELLAPDCQIHGMAAEVLVGADGFRPFWNLCLQNYRGIQTKIEECVVDGDWVAVFVSARSLHLHSFHEVEITGCATFRVREGQFIESHHVFDYLSVLGRCGAIEDVDARQVVFPVTGEE